MNEIIIYTKHNCPHCTTAKQYFSQKGKPYREINVEDNPDKLDEMLKFSSGKRVVPVIVENNKVTIGFNGGY